LRKDDHSLLLNAQKDLLCCITKLAGPYMKYPDLGFPLLTRPWPWCNYDANELLILKRKEK